MSVRARAHARALQLAPEPTMDFDTFYRAEFAAMVALARSVAGETSGGEDIAQEALAKAHRHWTKISTYERPGAWLRRVTINLAISRRRRVGREVVALRRKALERRPDETHDLTGPDDELWEAVRQLPPRQRAVIALFYLEDRTTKEIGEILGCTVSTATSHLHQARSRLAAQLGELSPSMEPTTGGTKDRRSTGSFRPRKGQVQ